MRTKLMHIILESIVIFVGLTLIFFKQIYGGFILVLAGLMLRLTLKDIKNKNWRYLWKD